MHSRVLPGSPTRRPFAATSTTSRDCATVAHAHWRTVDMLRSERRTVSRHVASWHHCGEHHCVAGVRSARSSRPHCGRRALTMRGTFIVYHVIVCAAVLSRVWYWLCGETVRGRQRVFTLQRVKVTVHFPRLLSWRHPCRAVPCRVRSPDYWWCYLRGAECGCGVLSGTFPPLASQGGCNFCASNP